MVGPYTPRCNCRCAIPFPDCFGCEVMELAEVPENIELVAADFAWTFPTTDVSYGPWRPAFGAVTYTTEYRTRTRDIANINGTKQMRVKPDGSCVWLWNDVRAVSSVYSDGISVSPRYLDETIYEPLNATDVTSPWDRVILPNTDYRCGYRNPKCITGIDASTSLILLPIEIFTPNTLGLSAGWHWRLSVYFKIARSALCGSAEPWDATRPIGSVADVWYVTPVNYSMRTAFPNNPFDYTSTATSDPPYKYEDGVTFPLGGLLAEYYAEIDCVNDFDGIPFTLTRNTLVNDQAADFDATVPNTLQATI